MFFSISKRPTIGEIHELYRDDKAQVVDVVKFFLNRHLQIDKQINAVNILTDESAIAAAEESDRIKIEYVEKYEKQFFDQLIQDYPLFGIPYFTKAIIQVEGKEFTAGSKILKGYKSAYSSTVYQKIKKARAILLGVCNMDEFATGSSGESSAYGATRNPYDLNRTPGGSSSGSVAVVASGQAVFSLGTDTGGSIRQPAAFTGVVGLKPTYGLVSRFGVIPMASSFDQVGPITNSVEDNLIVTRVLAGKDEKDQTSIESSDLQDRLNQYLESKKSQRKTKKIIRTTKSLKIGFPMEFYIDGIDLKIVKALDKLKSELEKIGHQIVEISVPLAKHAISVYYMTMPVELASNLERFDGIRYALQNTDDNSELYFTQRQNFGDEVKRRIMLGTYASSAGYYDAYYNHAQKVRELARRDFERAFLECDVMLTPTTPEFPFKLGEKSNDPLKMYLSDVFTCGINPVRIPGLTVPIGLFDVESGGEIVKLPTGCQILGPEKSEDLLFRLGEEIESLILG